MTITPKAIVGTPVSNLGTAEASAVKDRRVELDEITRVEKREIDAGKTVVFVVVLSTLTLIGLFFYGLSQLAPRVPS